MNRRILSVSFNLDDTFENELYEYALTNSKFSKYIKRLIDKDRSGPTVTLPVQMPMQTEESPSKISKAIAKTYL